MQYKLVSHVLEPIHLLRYLMRFNPQSVLKREWDVISIYTDIDLGPLKEGYGYEAQEVFPEHGTECPFRISGIRLVERVALVTQFEESEFNRVAIDGSDKHDLVIYADTAHLQVETDEENIYSLIKEYFDRTHSMRIGYYF